LETLQRVLGEGHLDTKATHTELAWAIARQGRWAEAESMFQLILGGQHNTYRSLPARHGLACVTARQGALSQAEAALRDIYHESSRLLGETHPDTLASLHDLAWVIAQEGRQPEAERIYTAVLRHREQALGKTHPDTAETERALKSLRQGFGEAGQNSAVAL
jgi:Tetratricopeptide repeat